MPMRVSRVWPIDRLRAPKTMTRAVEAIELKKTHRHRMKLPIRNQVREICSLEPKLTSYFTQMAGECRFR